MIGRPISPVPTPPAPPPAPPLHTLSLVEDSSMAHMGNTSEAHAAKFAQAVLVGHSNRQFFDKLN
jgi:hypothetical protein